MNEMTRPALFAELRKRNIKSVAVHFSGGNDEGGADQFIAVQVDGTEVQLDDPGVHEDWNTKQPVVHQWAAAGSASRPATPEEIVQQGLVDALEAPVYAEYGSFGGEFSVSGTVTWDVAAGKVKMAKSESVESYEDSEYEL